MPLIVLFSIVWTQKTQDVCNFTESSPAAQTSVLPTCLTERRSNHNWGSVCVLFCSALWTMGQLFLCPGLKVNHLSPSTQWPHGEKNLLCADCMLHPSRTNKDGTKPKIQSTCRFLQCPAVAFILPHTLMRAALQPAVRLSSLLY